MGDVEKGKIFVQNCAQGHIVEASIRLDQISRPGCWILLHRCQQEQRHHLERRYPDGVFGSLLELRREKGQA